MLYAIEINEKGTIIIFVFFLKVKSLGCISLLSWGKRSVFVGLRHTLEG